jgi:hypothetical protein
MKAIIACVTMLLFFSVSTADAARKNPKANANRGYCAPGSCAKNGGPQASDIRNCSPKYCKK